MTTNLALTDVNHEDGYLLGRLIDTGEPVRLPYTTAARHLATIGTTGVGKLTFWLAILAQQIALDGGAVFIDTKVDNEMIETARQLMKAQGREADFYVLNMADPANSGTYNPILSGDATEVASRLLKLMPVSEGSAGYIHYREVARTALTAIIGALKAARIKYTFASLSLLFQSASALDDLLCCTPEGEARNALLLFLAKHRAMARAGTVTLSMDELKVSLGGMVGRISQFAQGKFGQVMNASAPVIRLADIVTGNKVLYVVLPAMYGDSATSTLGQMLLSDLQLAVKQSQRPGTSDQAPPFCLFADDAELYMTADATGLMDPVTAIPLFVLLGSQGSPSAEALLQKTGIKVYFKGSRVPQGAQPSQEEMAKLRLGECILVEGDKLYPLRLR